MFIYLWHNKYLNVRLFFTIPRKAEYVLYPLTDTWIKWTITCSATVGGMNSFWDLVAKAGKAKLQTDK